MLAAHGAQHSRGRLSAACSTQGGVTLELLLSDAEANALLVSKLGGATKSLT